MLSTLRPASGEHLSPLPSPLSSPSIMFSHNPSYLSFSSSHSSLLHVLYGSSVVVLSSCVVGLPSVLTPQSLLLSPNLSNASSHPSPYSLSSIVVRVTDLLAFLVGMLVLYSLFHLSKSFKSLFFPSFPCSLPSLGQ